MTKHIPRIVSALVGLALVIYGGWLVMHDVVEAGALVLTGGLGTLGLPALLPMRATPEQRGPRRGPYGELARCTTTCDHGSRCTLPAGHADDGHETEHGCIAYDPRPPVAGAGLAIALVILAAALSAATSGCSSGAAIAPAAITARDLTCRGGRVVCRVVDRVCRTSGGPWVVPRSSEEIASDAASRLTRAEPDEPDAEATDESSAEDAGQ